MLSIYSILKLRRAWLLAVLLAAPAAVHADMDGSSQQGLEQTKQLLTNPNERQKFINQDAKAQDVDAKVSSLVTSKADKELIYKISAELMDKIVKEANGDPSKLQELIQNAEKDPKAFYSKYFSDSQQAEVRGISSKIESSPPKMSGKGN